MANESGLLGMGQDFPPCMFCKHLIEDGTLDGAGWTCKAYPDGIPLTILERIDDHRKELPGDNGFRFSPKEFVDEEDGTISVVKWNMEQVVVGKKTKE